jgi:protein-export membrane protein SecD
LIWLALILLIVAGTAWTIQSPDYPIRQGLDLQGGLQVLLEADVPEEQQVTSDQIDTARQIIDQRVNALGVAEPLVQVEEERRILVELPGIDNPEDAIALIQETALLEFIDTGSTPLPVDMCVRTSLSDAPSRCESEGNEGQPSLSTAPQFENILTGSSLREATAEFGQGGQHYVSFFLQPDAADMFAEYTRANQGQFLTIVLDKRVISSPRISAVIEGGAGTITGDFTVEEARKLALQLRFGSLPVPLKIASTRQVGATLGELSIASSIQAGSIGLGVVLLFMLVYYRLPGMLADLALLVYAMINLTLFKLIPVTLTLPAITGFVLSTGMAVDANILVFERMKEELRKGSSIREAIGTGFDRAWSSIRDSNIATLVICFILWTFGRNFGASVVQGFALTLAIGVMISMFTAVVVTRTFVRIVIGRYAKRLHDKKWLLGI